MAFDGGFKGWIGFVGLMVIGYRIWELLGVLWRFFVCCGFSAEATEWKVFG